MALIAMAVYDTVENQRTELTRRTLESLAETVDFTKHRLVVVDNNSCKETQDLLNGWIHGKYPYTVIRMDKNVGTAEAINMAWKHYRLSGENAVKMDNDIVIHSNDWLYLMEEAIIRNPNIGQVGLKRRDCMEVPDHPNLFYRSELIMLPHKSGEKWIIAEKVNHVMGSCVMHSSALLDKVGYLYQPKLYGFDDSFMSLRSRIAGFINIFLTGVDIEHIDKGDTSYQKWKENHANESWQAYQQIVKDYTSGAKSIYYNPFDETNNVHS